MARRNPGRVPDQDALERREDRARDDYDHDYAGQDYADASGYPADREGRPDYGRRWPSPRRRRPSARRAGGEKPSGDEERPPPYERRPPPPAPPERFWHGDFAPYGDEGFGAPGRDPYYGALGYRDQGGRGAYGENPYGYYGQYTDQYGGRYADSVPGRYGGGTRYGSARPWVPDEYRTAFYPRRTPGRARPRGPKGYQRSDEKLQELICEELMEADHIDSSDVTVTVQDGVVTLEGTVPERAMRYAIEDIADSVSGIKDIDNRIRVVPPE